MAVTRYNVSLLEFEQCSFVSTPQELLVVLKAWRKSHAFGHECSKCLRKIRFANKNYGLCCDLFYYDDRLALYPVSSVSVPTPGHGFLLPQLKRMLNAAGIVSDQDFLVLPDPIYWQLSTTLVYEKVLKYVLGLPLTSRRSKRAASRRRVDSSSTSSSSIPSAKKTSLFYKQIQEAPLNYGSLDSRSCGKATFIRQMAFGKRCSFSMRGMIVPDATLKPNEIRLPDFIVRKFGLSGKWIVLNRMPSLQPENFVGLRVPPPPPPLQQQQSAKFGEIRRVESAADAFSLSSASSSGWPHDCFGIPLEILPSINGDFDGDEVNVYLFSSIFVQAECAALLDPRCEMGSSVMGMKLSPCQDMLVAYHLFYDRIHFLPYKQRDLKKTLRVIYEIFGSEAAFEAFDALRLFYLDALENECCFALTLEEMNWLIETIAAGGDIRGGRGCLVTQILAGAKGNFEHLYQMFGRGEGGGDDDEPIVRNSFWSGLSSSEAVTHAKTSHEALWLTSKIWQPGYGHNKVMFNVQGLVVDYLGRLMDGTKRVVERDVLDAVHHTDVLSEETFDYILKRVLIEKKFDLGGKKKRKNGIKK